MEEYLNEKSNETGFQFDLLEKQFHITNILEMISNDSFLGANTLLKGGTAIQGVWGNLSRLSYDIDVDFTGELIKEKMIETRPFLIEKIREIGLNRRYIVVDKSASSSYIIGRIFLKYNPIRRPSEKVKIEINFLNRIPLTPVIEKKFHNIFPEKINNFSIRTYNSSEILAIKTVTFLVRQFPRDLFDIYTLIKIDKKINPNIVKKLILFNLCMIPANILSSKFDIRNFQDFMTKLSLFIKDLSKKTVRERIKPFLPMNYDIDLENIKNILKNFYTKLPPLEQKEKSFWDSFFHQRIFKPELVTRNSSCFNPNIKNHPSILWRLKTDSPLK